MKNKIVLIGTFLLLISVVSAQPGIPHQFYGDVDFNNGPAPDGTVVTALIDGDVVATTLTLNGRYGYTPNIFYVDDPFNSRLGETVSFFVNGEDTGMTETFIHDGYSEINLFIERDVANFNFSLPVENETLTVTGSPLVIDMGHLTITLTSENTSEVDIQEVSDIDTEGFEDLYALGDTVNAFRGYEIRIVGDVVITVTISYEGIDLEGINENSIAPYIFKDGIWLQMDSFVLDKDNKIISFEIESAATPYMVMASSWFCGDTVCNNGESCSSCAEDCGSCPTGPSGPSGPSGSSSIPPCESEWECGEWEECVDGKQTRVCEDKNSCGIPTDEPAEEKACGESPSEVVCEVGDRLCDGDDLLECEEGNTWKKIRTCDEGCEDDKCVGSDIEVTIDERASGISGDDLTGMIIDRPVLTIYGIFIIIVLILIVAVFLKVR